MRDICSEFNNDLVLEKGSGLSIFKFLISNRIIDIDIIQKIDVNNYYLRSFSCIFY